MGFILGVRYFFDSHLKKGTMRTNEAGQCELDRNARRATELVAHLVELPLCSAPTIHAKDVVSDAVMGTHISIQVGLILLGGDVVS